jgi:hypothetical protein
MRHADAYSYGDGYSAYGNSEWVTYIAYPNRDGNGAYSHRDGN